MIAEVTTNVGAEVGEERPGRDRRQREEGAEDPDLAQERNPRGGALERTVHAEASDSSFRPAAPISGMGSGLPWVSGRKRPSKDSRGPIGYKSLNPLRGDAYHRKQWCLVRQAA